MCISVPLNVNVKQAENVPSLYTKKDNTHLKKSKCNTLSFPEVFAKIREKILLSEQPLETKLCLLLF